MKHAVRILVSLLLILMLTAGCAGKPSGAAKETTVAVILMSLNSDYWMLVKAGAEKAASDLGVKVVVMGPSTEADITGQVNMIEDQVTNEVDAIVLAPSQPAAVIPALEKAKAAGIPVINTDMQIDWEGMAGFAGTNNTNAGKLASEYLASNLKAGDKVAVVRGAEGLTDHDQRASGCIDGLKAKGIEVVAIQPANSDRGMAVSVAENILQNHPDIKGFFATSDQMALGVAQAVKNQGLLGKVLVCGLDGEPDALNAILNGDMSATVAQLPFEMGRLSVEMAVKTIKKESFEKNVDTGCQVVTSDNAKEFLDTLNKALGKS